LTQLVSEQVLAGGTSAESLSPWRAEIVVLFAIALLQGLDRTVMSGLLQPIKQTFALSDAMTGTLSGAAFGLAYAVLGLPFARVADVANRRWILCISLALWSACTLLCGYAIGFWSFFLARLGVGIFEAAGAPAMFALCADRLAKSRRSSAASVMLVGGALGVMIGIPAGGIVADHFGWRAAFWVAGIPGLVLGPLAFRFLVEPRPARGALRFDEFFGSSGWRACRTLFRKPAFCFFLLASLTLELWYFGTAAWFITYLIRSHHASLSEAAFGYGVLSGTAFLVGAVLNAYVGDRLARRDIRWLGWLPALAVLICMFFAVPVYLVTSVTVALLLYVIASMFTGVIKPAQFAAMYALTGSESRATGVAVLNFSGYMVGLTVAAAAIGALSDRLSGTYGENSLGVSLLIATGALPLSAGLFAYSTKFFATDVEQD